MSFIQEVKHSLQFAQQQEGWRAALHMSTKFLTMPFFEHHKGYLLRKALNKPIIIPPPKINVTIRKATEGDLALFETAVPRIRAKRFIKKLQAGEVCFVAIWESAMVGFVWAGFADSPSTKSAGLELDPTEAYLWAGYAPPRYRSQGIVRTVNLTLIRWLQKQGYQRVVLLVEQDNAASLKHCYRMGYRLESQITYRRLLKWKRVQFPPVNVTILGQTSEVPQTSEASPQAII